MRKGDSEKPLFVIFRSIYNLTCAFTPAFMPSPSLAIREQGKTLGDRLFVKTVSKRYRCPNQGFTLRAKPYGQRPASSLTRRKSASSTRFTGAKTIPSLFYLPFPPSGNLVWIRPQLTPVWPNLWRKLTIDEMNKITASRIGQEENEDHGRYERARPSCCSRRAAPSPAGGQSFCRKPTWLPCLSRFFVNSSGSSVEDTSGTG